MVTSVSLYIISINMCGLCQAPSRRLINLSHSSAWPGFLVRGGGVGGGAAKALMGPDFTYFYRINFLRRGPKFYQGGTTLPLQLY